MKVNLTNKESYAINPLRFIFILFIVLYHVNVSFGTPVEGVLGPIYRWGGLIGNIWFFVTSGLAMAINYKQRIVKRQISLGDILKKYLLKIYPLYFFTNTFMLILSTVGNNISQLSFRTVFMNYTLTTTGWVDDIYPYNYPCWFLSQLLFVYIVFYFLTYICKDNSIYAYMIIVAICYAMKCYSVVNIPFLYRHDIEGGLYFFSGCILSELITNWEKKWLDGFAIVGTAIIVLYASFIAIVGLNIALGDVSLFCIGALYPTIIIFVICNAKINSLLNRRFWRWLGKFSMYMFLLHVPLLMCWKYFAYIIGLDMVGVLPMAVYVVALIIVSYIIYWCEKYIRSIFYKRAIWIK